MAKRDAIIIFAALLLTIEIFTTKRSFAQDGTGYDEISVFFSVPRIGGTDLSAVVSEDEVYLSIPEVFTFLKIKNTSTTGFNTITGFILNEREEYLIDRVNNRITYQQKVYDLKPGDILRTETNLYLKSKYFGEIFGLECIFNFRTLAVSLNSKIELPIIREMRQEQMRKSLSQIQGEIEADTTLKRNYPLFRFGMADWSVISTQQQHGQTDTRLMLNLGSVLAGGEANVSLNYDNNTPFRAKDQYYQWRYANNDHKAIRQVMLGKVSSNAISTLTSSVIGLQFTNTPTTYRRSFGTYTLSDVTEPGWMVELYVNNVLVDYKKADASGFYTFEVPMVYGSTDIKLQFYGPWGEERSKEQSLNIPFNFLPAGDFEYRVTAGILEENPDSRFSRANFDYGVTRYLTVGGGVEYLSTLQSGKIIPFVSTSLRLAPSLLLSGEYNYGVSANGVLSWRLKSDVQFELNYTKYDKNQTAISTNYLEERKFSVSAPIRFAKTALYSRFSLNQIIMPYTKSTTAELLLSGVLFGSINTNLTTNAMIFGNSDPNVYSNFSFSLKLPGAFILTPQAQYNYSQGEFVSAKGVLEKKLFKKGYMSLSYDRNFSFNTSNLEFGFRYDFSFAQVGVSARKSNDTYSFVESATGSVMIDPKTNYVGANSRSSVGKGGMTLFPFLDMNCNGKRDKGEPKAFGLRIQINGGRTEINDKDTTIRVFDLESYANYLVTLDGSDFDNIAWQMRNKTLSVTIDPNQFRLIEIPVSVLGEASGTVYLEGRNGQNGQGRIIVNFYRNDSTLVKSILSEPDGYFSYLGLAPGKYLAGIDTVQMHKLRMTASPVLIPFTIQAGHDGDVVDGLDFVLRKDIPVEEHDDAAGIVNNTVDTLYKVQLLALRKPIRIEKHFSKLLANMPGLSISETLEEDGLYHYCTIALRTRKEAAKLKRDLKKRGFKDCFVTIYMGYKRVKPKGF